MAIEHLHLEPPVSINPADLPYQLMDQLLAERGAQMQPLEPGRYDMTPENTGYDRGPIDYIVEVTPQGTAICGQDRRQAIIHPVRGKIGPDAMYMPDIATQLAIIDMRRLSLFGIQAGLPHIFDILRWRPDDDTLAYSPGIAIATSDPLARQHLKPHLLPLQAPPIF